MRRFKAKRKANKIVIKLLLFIVIVLVVVYFTFNKIYNITMKKMSNEDVINIMINNDTKNIKKIFKNDGFNFIVNYTFGLDLSDNKNVKEDKEDKKTVSTSLPVINEVEYNNPLIYIYNTHQTEEYKGVNNNSYNVTPTVLHASYIFKNKLSNLGIKSLVEENNIQEILNANAWNYRQSYKASKMLANDALSKNPSIKYVIDIHRDSIPEYIGKVTINNKDYAKMMIVLGKGHDGFEDNLAFATRINNHLKEFDPTITRGIDIKERSGIFNQDINKNAVLIEVGGQYNDINSVANSMEVLANIYKKVIDEDNET